MPNRESTEPPATVTLPEGAYRCAACGHGERLYACADAIVSGRLLPDGEVSEDDVTQTWLLESSIDCEDHPAPASHLERWCDGHWTRWVHCMWRDDRYCCVAGTQTMYGTKRGPCPECKGTGGRWLALAASGVGGSA